MTYGWDHPETAQRYEAFCERHDRYQRVNAELVRHAEIAPGQRVADMAAGTGRTAEPLIAAGAQVVCWEPAVAMRRVGMRRVQAADWPEQPPKGQFDRVLCGAAAWQWRPFADFAGICAALLAPGGALVFAIPSLYLGIAEESGGGADPLLLALPALLAQGRVPDACEGAWLSAESVEADLRMAGFEPLRWSFRLAITQACQCDWYRIPVLTDALLSELDAQERDARIAEARRELDDASWKWEGWTGWTAWKR